MPGAFLGPRSLILPIHHLPRACHVLYCCGFLKMSRGGTTFLRLQTTPRVNQGDRLWKPAVFHVGDEAGGILQGDPDEVGWGRPCTDVR